MALAAGAALLALVSGCADSEVSPEPRGLLAQKVELTWPVHGVTSSWRLPADMRPADFGISASAEHAFFALAVGDDPLPASGQRAQWASLDLGTGELRTHRAERADREATVGSVVTDAAGGDWVVRREAGPADPSQCPKSPQYCWDWTLYAQQLPAGKTVELASSTKPGPQFFLPVPVVSGHRVLWLDGSKRPGTAALDSWSPGDGRPARLADELPIGRLSARGDTLLLSPTRPGKTRAFELDAATGRRTPVRLPAQAGEATFGPGGLAYVVRRASGPVRVFVRHDGRDTEAYRASDIYLLVWTGDQLVIGDPSGTRISDGTHTEKLPISDLAGVRTDNDRVGLTRQVAGRAVVSIIDVGESSPS